MSFGSFKIILSIYYSHFICPFGLAGRVVTNGPGDSVSISGRVIPKTQKWYLMLPCLTLNIIRNRSRVKWSNLRKVIAPYPTPWCSS